MPALSLDYQNRSQKTLLNIKIVGVFFARQYTTKAENHDLLKLKG